MDKIIYKSNYFEGIASVILKDASWGFIDEQEQLITKGFKYTHRFYDGLAFVKIGDNSYGYFDKKTLIPKEDTRLKEIELSK
jgi:hypothetical protein